MSARESACGYFRQLKKKKTKKETNPSSNRHGRQTHNSTIDVVLPRVIINVKLSDSLGDTVARLGIKGGVAEEERIDQRRAT